VGVDHYENFPVASFLLPSSLHAPVKAIYWFAREADDLVDEGVAPPEQRLRALDDRLAELAVIESGGEPGLPIYRELAQHIRARSLPLQPFRDLLDAFRQDVTKTRYADFDEVLDYCRRSANPIGRLLLALYGESGPDSPMLSDRICSSLQIINFLQDITPDFQQRNRVYLPQEDLRRFGLTEDVIAAGQPTPAWRDFMRFQAERAHRMLEAGRPLGGILRGRIGLELRAIVNGGARVLEKIRAADGDVFRQRPVLRGADWPAILIRALVR
jgi:squalene synthase HpnC